MLMKNLFKSPIIYLILYLSLLSGFAEKYTFIETVVFSITIFIIVIILIYKFNFFNTSTKFSGKEIKNIDLEKGIEIEINYLGEEEHVEAFIDIFEEVFLQNDKLVNEFKRIEIQNKNVELVDFYKDLRNYGKILYYLGDEEVKLNLNNDTKRAVLKVGFDDPCFILKRI